MCWGIMCVQMHMQMCVCVCVYVCVPPLPSVDSKRQRVGLIENFEAAANYELQVSLSVCLSPSLFTAALSNDL